MQVAWWDYDAQGNDVLLQGTVEAEFREPEWEDRNQRLNYRVRCANGEVYTPYASECRPVVETQEVVVEG